MKHRFLILGTATSLMILLILLETTSPSSAGPFGILVLFVVMYTSVLGVLTYFFMVGSRIAGRIARTMKTRVPIQPLSLLHAYYYSSVLSLAPIMLIGMKSVGDLGVTEVFLVVIFMLSACVYIKKRT